MLATAKRQLFGDGWAYDAKLDGWRAVVHVGGAGVAVYSRPGRDITAMLPSLQALAGVVPVGTVLDGELVAGSGGASSFYRLATLMATRPERRAAEDGPPGARASVNCHVRRESLLGGIGRATRWTWTLIPRSAPLWAAPARVQPTGVKLVWQRDVPATVTSMMTR